MLQQTTVKAVAAYYTRFSHAGRRSSTKRCGLDDVLRRLGRAWLLRPRRNLHACAQAIVAQHGGVFRHGSGPGRASGIGHYTAAAVAAIAFDPRAVPVDGNIERVVARLFAVEDCPAGGKA